MRSKMIRIIILLIVFVGISILGISQYLEKIRYESYLSLQISNNISLLTSSILNNQNIYDDLLQTKMITLGQVEEIYNNNFNITRIAQEYDGLAVKLKRESGKELNNQTAINASIIAFYFRDLIWEIAKQEGVVNVGRHHLPIELSHEKNFLLENDNLEKVETIKQLNALWVHAITENIDGVNSNGNFDFEEFSRSYRDRGLKMDYWVSVIVDMEHYTKEFLNQYNFTEDLHSVLYH